MHPIEISPQVVERLVARRGRLHIFDDLEPARTAHIVIDLQNGFMAPGQPGEIKTAREIVPNVNRISAALRAVGGLVVFVQYTIDAADLAAWSVRFDKFSNAERRAGMAAAFAPGSFGHALWPGLEVAPSDLIVPKHRYSAFVPGSSGLHAILAARRIDTLIVTGTAANVCCESTARDAMMMNYQVIFVADATATHSDEEHKATLANMMTYADVMLTDELIGFIVARGAR